MPLGSHELKLLKAKLANEQDPTKVKDLVMKAVDIDAIFKDLTSEEFISRDTVSKTLETQLFTVLNQLEMKMNDEDKQALITNVTDMSVERQGLVISSLVNQLLDFLDKVLGTSLLEKGSKADISSSIKENTHGKFESRLQEKIATSKKMDVSLF